MLPPDAWIGNRELTLRAPWADEVTQREDLIDFRLQPVWHLECRRGPATVFDLETSFVCRPGRDVSGG